MVARKNQGTILLAIFPNEHLQGRLYFVLFIKGWCNLLGKFFLKLPTGGSPSKEGSPSPSWSKSPEQNNANAALFDLEAVSRSQEYFTLIKQNS